MPVKKCRKLRFIRGKVKTAHDIEALRIVVTSVVQRFRQVGAHATGEESPVSFGFRQLRNYSLLVEIVVELGLRRTDIQQVHAEQTRRRLYVLHRSEARRGCDTPFEHAPKFLQRRHRSAVVLFAAAPPLCQLVKLVHDHTPPVDVLQQHSYRRFGAIGAVVFGYSLAILVLLRRRRLESDASPHSLALFLVRVAKQDFLSHKNDIVLV